MSDAGRKLFVGVRVAVPVANALAGCAETLARRARDAGIDVRWVAPVNYHLTVKYLGWTREETVAAVRTALGAAAAGTPRLAFRTSRLGAFKSIDKAAVLWAGVTDDGTLAQLAQKIDAAMAELGFPAETRPFHPHVTLGRLRDPKPMRDVVLPLAEQMFGETRVEAITLLESKQTKQLTYVDVARIDFKTGANPPSEAPERQREPVELGANTNPAPRDPAPIVVEQDTDDGWPRGQGPIDS